jgi:chromosome segregation ATPase
MLPFRHSSFLFCSKFVKISSTAQEELARLSSVTDAFLFKSDSDIATLRSELAEKEAEIDELMSELQTQGLEINRLNKELKRKQDEISYFKDSFIRLDSTTQTRRPHLDVVSSSTVHIGASVDIDHVEKEISNLRVHVAQITSDKQGLAVTVSDLKTAREADRAQFLSEKSVLTRKIESLRSDLNLATRTLGDAINKSDTLRL